MPVVGIGAATLAVSLSTALVAFGVVIVAVTVLTTVPSIAALRSPDPAV